MLHGVRGLGQRQPLPVGDPAQPLVEQPRRPARVHPDRQRPPPRPALAEQPNRVVVAADPLRRRVHRSGDCGVAQDQQPRLLDGRGHGDHLGLHAACASRPRPGRSPWRWPALAGRTRPAAAPEPTPREHRPSPPRRPRSPVWSCRSPRPAARRRAGPRARPRPRRRSLPGPSADRPASEPLQSRAARGSRARQHHALSTAAGPQMTVTDSGSADTQPRSVCLETACRPRAAASPGRPD